MPGSAFLPPVSPCVPTAGSCKGKSRFFTRSRRYAATQRSCAGCCAQPSLLCLQFALWFLVFLFLFFFSGCPEMLKELLTTPGKLIKTFQTERLLAAASFPMPCSFLLDVAEKPGSLAPLLLMVSGTTCESGAACSCHSRTR